MTQDTFAQAHITLHANGMATHDAAYPKALEPILGTADCQQAAEVIRQWPGYAPTPLSNLDSLAAKAGVGQILYKDEGPRFGLGSFKALGGAYAVLHLLQRELGKNLGRAVAFSEIMDGSLKDACAQITVVTATDGNHGRSVAWGAQNFGCGCRIYMHAGVSRGRADAVEAFGAEVIWVDGNYDASVRAAANDAETHGWHIVSDTSYEGYMDLPRQVMAGYTVMTGEIADQLPDGQIPTHVFLQGGVGGLAGAVCAHFWQLFGAKRPRVIIVEPEQADCLKQSAIAGEPTLVDIQEETVMAGLSCGEVSLLGWEVLKRGADDFLTIPDGLVPPVMRLLADDGIIAGESAVAGLSALLGCLNNAELAKAVGLDENSRILLIGTEGATDPAIYRELVGRDPAQIAA